MLKLGIIGYPLEHTFSPIMHMAALQSLNIKGEYKPYEIKENELEKKIIELKELDLKGFNVTVPHKTKIIPLIDKLTDTAKHANAVNTVTILEGGKTIGDNTDVIGFWEAIPKNIRKKIPEQNVSILGCGGSASAIAIALLLNNVKSIKIYGRNENKLSNLKKFIRSTKVEMGLLKNIDLSNANIVINTTPIGMFPKINDSPIVKEELKKLSKDALVYDIIYNPQETKLLKDAKLLNLKTLNGIEMLIRQGAASLNIWLGKNVAPIETMRLAVLQSLEQEFSMRIN